MSPGWASSAAMTCDDSSADRNSDAGIEGRPRLAVDDLHPRKTLCTPALAGLDEGVDLVAAECVDTALHADALHTGGLEHAGLGAFEDQGELDGLHPEPGVGLVQPYRSCASSQVMRANSVGRSPVTASAALATA